MMKRSPPLLLEPTEEELNFLDQLARDNGCELSQFDLQIIRYQATLGKIVEVVVVRDLLVNGCYGRHHPKSWVHQLKDDIPLFDTSVNGGA